MKDLHSVEVYFVNNETPPIKTKHICYFTKSVKFELELYEVVEEYFPHPDAPDDCMIQCIKVYHRDTQKLTNFKGSPLLQSLAAENTLKMQYPINQLEND